MKKLKVFEHSVKKDKNGRSYVSVNRTKLPTPFLKSKGVDEALAEAKLWLKRKHLLPKTINIDVNGDVVAVVRRGA
jgi:hypothetical protein